MNIEIQARGIPSNKDVHNFIRRRADLALNALRDQIGLVSVFVDGANVSDKVGDIRCLVLIRLGTHPMWRSKVRMLICIPRSIVRWMTRAGPWRARLCINKRAC